MTMAMILPVVCFALVGLSAGSLSGLLGIGGGIIIVPCLVFGFGFSEHLAQGTTLAFLVAPSGYFAARKFYRKGRVNIPVAAWICLGFFFGGLLGAKLGAGLSNTLMERIFAIFLFVIALKVLFTGPGETDEDSRRLFAGIRLYPALGLVVLGLASGAVGGFIGIGAGVMIVPALVLIFGMSQHEAQGTTLALMVPPIGLLAAWQYYHQGDVNIVAAAALCAGFVPGSLVGARLAEAMSSRILMKVFGCSMFLIAIKMVL